MAENRVGAGFVSLCGAVSLSAFAGLQAQSAQACLACVLADFHAVCRSVLVHRTQLSNISTSTGWILLFPSPSSDSGWHCFSIPAVTLLSCSLTNRTQLSSR